MRPTWFYLFGYPIHMYPVMIALGFIIGIALAARRGERLGMDREMILDLGWWLLVSGLVGSRVVFIIVNWDQYWYACVDIDLHNQLHPELPPLTQPDCFRILRFWSGGLVFYGGIIGAILTMIWFLRREKLSFLPIADALIPSVAIGQFFGRLGCLSAGCCFGKPSGVPWAVHFPRGSMAWIQHIKEGLLDRHSAELLSIHPTQLYDSGFGLLLFLILLWLHHRKRWHGQVFVWYLLLYPLGRSIIELFRGDQDRGYLFRVVSEDLNRFLGVPVESITFLSTSQFISLCVVGVAALFLLRNSRLRSRV